MSDHHDQGLLGQRALDRSLQRLVFAEEAEKLGFSASEIESLKRLYEPHLEEQRNDE